jgi:hypothetical protein
MAAETPRPNPSQILDANSSPPQFSHPMLKGFLISLLISLLYIGAGVFVVFNPYCFGPGMFWILVYSFFPVLFGVNIGGMAAYLKAKYHTLNGLEQYGAGVLVVGVLDFILAVVLFILLLFVVVTSPRG